VSDRKSEHWTVVDWAERAFGLVLIGAGMIVLRWEFEIPAGLLIGAGIVGVMPKARPYLSRLIDRVPGLPSKGDAP
jgi:hypothetical protein